MNRTEMDYYAVLNVPRSATHEEITLAYRRLAIRLNPKRNPKHDRDFIPNADEDELTHMTPLSLNRQWEYINMAYDVLGNQLHREIYNRFGEAGLFQGILLPNGYFPPYQYDGDHMRVYHSVFGSYSPYANLIDVVTNPPILYTTREHGIGVRTKEPPVEKIIPLGLEEVRFGCVKLMHVWRQEFVDDKQTHTEKIKKTLTLNIAPGTTAGTRYCFPEEGDRAPTKIPADIIFIATDKPHDRFKRRNHHDLVYTHEIDLCQALSGFQVVIATLDKRNLKIPFSDVIYPGYTKVIPNEGLPKCVIAQTAPQAKQSVEPMKFGDLIIEFTIKFPAFLNRDMKRMCRDFFADLHCMEQETLADKDSPLQKFIKKKK